MLKKIILILLTCLFLISFFNVKMIYSEHRIHKLEGKDKIKAYLDVANNQLEKNPQKAIEYGLKALDYIKRKKILEEKAPAFILILGSAYYKIGDNDEAMKFVKKGEKLAKRYKDNKVLGEIYNLKGMIFFRKGEYKQTIKYFNRSKGIAEKNKDRVRLAGAYNNIGIVYESLDDYDSALEYYNKSLEIKEKIGNKSLISSTLNNIGVVHKIKGEYDKALDFYFRSVRIKEKIGDKQGLASTLSNIGSIYKELENYETALEYAKKSLGYDRGIGNKRGEASTLKNIGGIYRKQKMFDKALEYDLKALKIRNKLGEKSEIASSQMSLGSDYKELGDYDNALKYFLKALKVKKKLKEKRNSSEIYYSLGELYLRKQNTSKAFYYLNESQKIAEEIQAKTLLKKLYKSLSLYYENNGNYIISLKYFKKFKSISDEILDVNTRQKIANIQTRHETEKKDREIKLLKQKRTIQKLKLQKEKIFRNRLMIVLVLLTGIVFLVFAGYRIKTEANKTIKLKNDKLAEAYKKLDKASRIDPLTRLSNRRNFREKLEQEKIRYERNNRKFSIVICDIDNFKSINDNFGHECGDFVLARIASLIKQNLRKQDLAGRWGGEEFVLLLPETEQKGALILSEKIRKTVSKEKFKYDKQKICLSMTFGIAVFDGSITIEETIRKADQAMYRGKRKGKNCVMT